MKQIQKREIEKMFEGELDGYLDYGKCQCTQWTFQEEIHNPNGYSSEHDYFFVTDIQMVKNAKTGESVGAFHFTFNNGGVFVKFIGGKNGATRVGAATHEFGHWLGLPRTWEKNERVKVIFNSSKGGTRDNFMDYKIRRKKWVKCQLLNYKR